MCIKDRFIFKLLTQAPRQLTRLFKTTLRIYLTNYQKLGTVFTCIDFEVIPQDVIKRGIPGRNISSQGEEVEEKFDEKVEKQEYGEFGSIISPKRVYKNLAIISLAWVLQFTAFQAMANLQSSLNQEGNVGVVSLAILYAFLVLSSALLPNAIISVLGLKWTISIAQVTYLLYILANIHPIGGLMYPAAILVGLGAAPLWTSQSTYITQIGNVYAIQKNINAEAKVAQFFGIFFMCFQTSQIWGNLISYFVLSTDNKLNESLINYSQCGGNYNPSTSNLSVEQAEVPQSTRNLLIGIYVGACVLSILVVIFFLDQRKKPTSDNLKQTIINSLKLVKSAGVHMKNLDQLLLIFMTIWNGLEQSFIGAQFTQGLITCAYGIENIGLIVTYINRRYLIMFAYLLSLIVLIVMITWTPGPGQLYVCFLLIAIWAVADAIYLTQMYAFYGFVFKNNLEPAYSNYRLWESIGFVVAYAYTPFIRVKDSAIVLIVILTLGVIGFGVVDIRYNFPTIWTKVTRQPAPSIDSKENEEKQS
ncbi:hypothetical protein GJ496_003647 [Pomphorhynchus laevis]|nr:hypothetical protein GJ496_003647 [Pomphorhynchus laevis]